MPTISYRANTLSQHFPFLSMHHGRTIIVPKQDQAFALRANVLGNPADEDKDIGIPQAYYMHNVMPVSEGLRSIGFTQQIAGIPGKIDFNAMAILRDPNENRFLYSPSNGANYVFDGNVGAWASIPLRSAINPFPTNSLVVTIAYVNGHTYVCYKNTGIFEYNSTTKVFDVVTLTGVVAANLNGITSSNGFLIGWNDFNVFRSSGLDPLNLTPDITTGAGFSIPQDIKGKIVICLPVSTGFIIYTTANAIGASFTQNIRFPFNYIEIMGSGGIIPPTQIFWQYNGPYHYIWTRAGLQRVDKSNAIPSFGDITDFLSDKIFEDYDEVNDVFVQTNLGGNLLVQVSVIEKRFLVVSYGIVEFTHALIYDLIYKRWGKIKLTHVAAFEFFIPSIFNDVTWNNFGVTIWDGLGATTWNDLASQLLPAEHAKQTLAFLQKDGTVQTINFDLTQLACAGVCVLGKYQYVRERLLQLNEIEVNSIPAGSNFTLKVLPSMDGSTLLPAVTPYLAINSGKYRKYQCDVWGKNHSIVAKGSFDLSSLELTMNPGYKIG